MRILLLYSMIVRVYYKSGIYEEGIENFHKFLSIFVDKSSILFAMLFASETEVDKMDVQSWIVELTDLYQSFGIVFAVLICFLEAFFPVLPLSAFIVANSAAFGFINGFLLSATGSILGTWLLYGLFRFFGNRSFFKKWTTHEKVFTYRIWMEKHGLILITLFMFFPVFPNSIITIVAGVTGLNFKRFALASAVGISALTLLFSAVGFDLTKFITSPILLLVVFAVLSLIYLLSIYLKKKLHKREVSL